MAKRVYKILTAGQWQAARDLGTFAGSPLDQAAGYIHLSAAHQVAGTLQLYFPGQDNLVLLALDPDLLGPDLRWEIARDNQEFPHLYRDLPVRLVLSATPIRLNAAGVYEYRLDAAPNLL